MFSFLKKKINSFTEKVKGKLEKKEEQIIEEQEKQLLEKVVSKEEKKEQVLERLEEEHRKELEEQLEKEEIPIQPEEKDLAEDLTEEEREVLAEIKEEEKKRELEEKAEEGEEAIKEIEEKIEKGIKERTEKEVFEGIEEKDLEDELSEEERKVLAEVKEEVEAELKEKQLLEKVVSKEEKKPEKIEELEEDKLEKEELIERVEETRKEIEVPKEEFAEKAVKEELAKEPIKEEEFEEKFEEKLEKEIEEKRFGKEKIEFEPEKIASDLLKERELKAKVSLTSKVKKFFTGKIKIEEKDVKDFLEEFELALMEADVEQETSARIVEGIKEDLVGKEITGKNITEVLKKEIASILEKLMQVEGIDLNQRIAEKKPFVILFLGPNGAGKTTSIAKIAFKFKEQGKTVILAAADTFRAASIEQIEKHSQRLGARLVKHKYGSDPAAVAFDAVKAAEAKNIDLVLIDSAGRQETNVNLMNELKKIDRVVKPDLKLFVGEAMAGNSLYEQAKEFKEKIGFDGFILTKIDTDAKGGTAISLISGLQKPVVFVGTGQGYKDLVEFTPKFITERIIK